jgi:hypothetical protein
MSVMQLLHATLCELPGSARRHVERNASGGRFPPIVTEVESLLLLTNQMLNGYAQLDIKNLINSRDTQFIWVRDPAVVIPEEVCFCFFRSLIATEQLWSIHFVIKQGHMLHSSGYKCAKT